MLSEAPKQLVLSTGEGGWGDRPKQRGWWCRPSGRKRALGEKLDGGGGGDENWWKTEVGKASMQ